MNFGYKQDQLFNFLAEIEIILYAMKVAVQLE